jgi:superfamily II DNA or RNA helicase
LKFKFDPQTEKLIVSEASRVEYHQLQLWLTRKVKGYQYMPAFKMGIWKGDQSYFENGKVNMGLWKECYNAAKQIGVKFVIENKEEFPLNREVTLESVENFCKDFFKNYKIKTKSGEWVPFMPYDYQIQTAYKILKNRYCMAEVATSGGKSLVISILMFYILRNVNPDAKFLIIVPSISLVTQFYENILEYNYGFNYLAKYDDLVEFRNHQIDRILEDESDYNPIPIKMEEIMSDRPRKYKGKDQPNIFIGTYQSLDKWPKGFFQQFHTVAVDEAHGARSNTLTSILKKTFGKAYNRFGVSGTFPREETLEILTIQSVLGPKVTQIEAETLVKSGTITPMEIKAVVLNHFDKEMNEKLHYIKKMGAGADAFRIEKDFIQNSPKRLEFIKKLVDKCDDNTLLLFHTIEYGQAIFNKLKEELPDKEFYYIDGEVSGKKREIIKKEMEKTKEKVEWTILNFGEFEVEVKSDFKVLLSDGNWKLAGDITPDDDIDDNFLKKIKKYK